MRVIPFDWKRVIPHIVAVALFVSIAVVYCGPLFTGKVLNQADVAGWMGSVHQMQQYKAAHGHFPLWNNSMFGGMPGYQTALESRNLLSLSWLHYFFTLFLPAPVSFFFLLCISFYFLTQVLRINPWIGILAALAYGYASFSPILVVAGHETEIQAMGYAPFLLGALLLLYQGHYRWGTFLVALFSGLLVSRNHPQITYYFLIIAGALTLAFVVQTLRARRYKHVLVCLALAAVAGALGALTNATNLLTTYEYSQETARSTGLRMEASQGGNSFDKKGPSLDYAFQWSYGQAETMTLLVPDVYGGASQTLGKDSRLARALERGHLPAWESDQFFTAFNAYWGDQPDTTGPVYLGAIVCFLFLFAAVYTRSLHRVWIIPLTVLAILMAWGKHFAPFNTFLFHHLPFYNKFRAPSMILYIPQLTVPLLVALGLQQLFFEKDPSPRSQRRFHLALILTGAVLLTGVALYLGLDYQSARDIQRDQYLTQINKVDPVMGKSFLQAATEDRQDLFGSDLLRSALFIAGAALCLGLFIRRRVRADRIREGSEPADRVRPGFALAGLTVLVFVDLLLVDTRYLGYHSYLDKEEAATSISPTTANQEISADTGYYRVLNLSEGLNNAFQESETSYFHNSLGGYHPAKLALIEDLITYQLSKQPVNQAVLDMFNTKYVIVPHPLSPVSFSESSAPARDPVVVRNPGALGACWLVRRLHPVPGPAEAMRALDHFDPMDSALIEAPVAAQPQYTSGDSIHLVSNQNDDIFYTASAKAPEFAVFSEIYYPLGWKAYIDGQEAPIRKVDYALRGLAIPPGQHEIHFAFRPVSFYTGEKIAAFSTWVMLLLFVGTLAGEYRRRRRNLL
ncbi:YfhO family protein [Dinghuibacter silviterrae]|uniref:Membrane protein YfhO n=1 Tax=Dinghuibacter silviterrae TaxID=1539049 RepID=A0A4R8DVW9_9BACT|nr:YfhO family protein [Dinghuibacter silviterrae]TDX01361.1 membrane protein YfhO [Dinghuibacter silviterrae]